MKPGRPRAEDVVQHVDRCWNEDCARCSARLGGHDAVVGLMLGFADEPWCLACLAAHHGRERGAFLEDAYQNVRRLACYRAGWRHADERLARAGPWPADRIPERLRMPPDEDDLDDDEEDAGPTADADLSPVARLEAAVASSPHVESWDAGDRGCGELALELKLTLRRLPAGRRLLLCTTDPGAPADIPAWCRLTGNILVAAAPPRFLIESCARSSRNDNPEPPTP